MAREIEAGRETEKYHTYARTHTHTHDMIVRTDRETADRHADTERSAFHVHSSGTPTYY